MQLPIFVCTYLFAGFYTNKQIEIELYISSISFDILLNRKFLKLLSSSSSIFSFYNLEFYLLLFSTY